MTIITILLCVLGFVLVLRDKPIKEGTTGSAKRINDINEILQKDRSVCDFINSLEGWNISPIKSDGLRIPIKPSMPTLPEYYLYIVYDGVKPTDIKIKQLHEALIGKTSIVSQAHRQNIPYEQYVNEKDVDGKIALQLCIPIERYRKYKKWYEALMQTVDKHGIQSELALIYRAHIISWLKNEEEKKEWNRYIDYQQECEKKMIRKKLMASYGVDEKGRPIPYRIKESWDEYE